MHAYSPGGGGGLTSGIVHSLSPHSHGGVGVVGPHSPSPGLHTIPANLAPPNKRPRPGPEWT